ncbi:unnamed protein product [Rotaria sp. Silwood2]|nr:unnamed protein product [Rotaria sp. Silwood2]
MDTGDLNLPAYKYQFEQVELALKAKPDDPELLKLKQDLEEVIQITAELLGYDPSILSSDETATSTNYNEIASLSYASSSQLNNTTTSSSVRSAIKWKTGDRCLAPWNEDGKYYECTIDDVLDDGTCTIVFDGFESASLTVVRASKLKPFDRTRPGLSGIKSAANQAKTKRELEQRLRELKRRKKEKKLSKLKEFEEEREKDKKRWTDFNSKLTSRTWKGVVSKSVVKTDKRTEQLRGTTNGYLISNYKPAQPRPTGRLLSLSRSSIIRVRQHLPVRYASSSSLPSHKKIALPALSPTMETGTIRSWSKKEGEKISEGDLLAEIETDKATLGFESSDEGYLAKILVIAGSKDVSVGKSIQGSGPNGRIIAEDVEKFIKEGDAKAKSETKKVKDTQETPSKAAKKDKETGARAGGYDERQISELQARNARRVTESKSTIPHYYLTIDIQLDEIIKLRQKLNDTLTSKSKGSKEKTRGISVNDFIIKAAALACKKRPETNSVWMDKIYQTI